MAEQPVTGDVFYDANGAGQLFLEELRRLAVDQGVRIAVGTDLVACIPYLFDQGGVPLRYVAEDEKGGSNAGPGQDLEHPMAGTFDAILVLTPVRMGDLEPLIPVLEVDREGVANL